MGLYEYLTLSNEEQWDLIWDKGEYVDTYKSIDCSFVLYAIDQFFVEVELDVLTGSIIGKSPFKHGVRLEKYGEGIDINKAPWD